MKRLLTGCLLALSLTGWGQLQFALEDPNVSFPPTTIDSTSTLSFVIINELSLPQEVSLTGLDAPFFPESESIVVPGNDTLSVAVDFVPVDVTTYLDTIVIAGNVFGSDSLVVSGEGTLPEVALLQETVDFETVSINSVHEREFQIVNTGVGTLVIGDIESSISEFSSSGFVEIPEGDTASFQVQFYTELADTYEGSLTIHTSDPFTPTVSLDLVAVAISEVGGTLCGNLTLINSPYVFVGDVTVPEECTLTIEPSVVVDLNGYVLNVQGTLEANGTPSDRITIENGQVQLTQEQFNTSYVDYSNNASLNLVNREVVYENDFESGSQPFRCYSPDWNGGNYNTSGEWSYGCDDFYNRQTDTWSANGQRSVRFYSYEYDGELQLHAPPSNLEAGLYQWSFNFKEEQSECASRTQAYYSVNEGGWQQFYSSPRDGYTIPEERFSPFSPFFEVPDGATVNIKIRNFINSTNNSYDQRVINIDDLRLEKVNALPIEAVLFSDQATLGGSSTGASDGCAIAGSSNALGGTGTAIQIQTGEGQSDAFWRSRPISIHSERLYVDFWERVTTADANCWYYTEYRKNEGNWILLRDQRNENCGSSMPTHDWEQRQYIIEDLDFGDQIELRLTVEAYDIGNPTYRDVTLYIDDFRIQEDFSQPVVLRSEGTSAINVSECEFVGDMLIVADSAHLTIANSPIEGIFIEGSNSSVTAESSSIRNIDMAYANSMVSLQDCNVEDLTGNGIYLGTQADLVLYDTYVQNCGGSGITVGSNSSVDLDYSFIVSNGGDGVELGLGSNVSVDNTLVGYNLGYGINSAGAAEVEYSVLRDNGKQGLKTAQFSTVDNSILWFNDGVPQMLTDNVFAVSYSNVQGINALLTSSSFAWGDGCIGTDPVFADDEAHLDPFSPCVDGGKPWEQDAHIPYGLGSSRADMGMYGGPANAFWGGQAPPDGAVVITDIFDIPDDQGGEVGLHFTASPFDFGGLGFNVTHYSIWRDLAVGSDLPTEVESGNWEQIGTVPAQGFNQYGYTAATLVDQMPDETSCLSSFLVIAHTTDDNIYWISEVASVCSIDNLAPDTPDMNGMVVEGSEGMPEAVISWAEVEVEDYFYTTVTNLATGFEATVYGDTLVVDASVEGGLTYDYAAVHVDIHGNVSDPAGLTLMVPGGEDFIPLHAGWNLVSFDRHPDVMPILELTGGLVDGNLQYITGFDGGAQFYDANGLPFLNTLTVLEGGRGYWFKVAQDDTLFVEGPRVLESDLPALVNGWNLVGYVSDEEVSVEDYYSDLLASDALLYVTGFTEQGVTIFNPGAPAFLNTLTGLTNSMGYWVKVDDGTAGMTTSSNPDFIVLNGSGASNHESIEIVNEAGDVVGVMHALEGGYAMTAAVYGTDPQTGQSTGVRHGEVLRFRQGGRWADETVVFDGSMKHHHVRFHFDQVNAVAQVFPNPSSDRVTFTFTGEGLLNAWDIMDASGRVVAQIAVEGHATSTTMDVSTLDAGMYLATPTGDGMSHVEPVTFQVIR